MDDIIPENVSESTTFEEFFAGIEGHMMNMVKDSYKAPSGMWEGLQAFASAINWTEPFITSLITLQVFVFVLMLIMRENTTAQFIIFMMIAVSVYMSERMNQYCSDNWRTLTTQNYFDHKGVFAGIFFAGPLLFTATCQLVNILRITSSTLIKVKRAQIRQKLRAQQLQQAAQPDGTASASEQSTVAREKTD